MPYVILIKEKKVKRNSIIKLLAVSVALAASGAASAGTLTLDQNGSVTDQGWTFSGLTGGGTLEFSSTLRGALSVANTKIFVIDPAIVLIEGPANDRTRIEAKAPVVSTRGVFDGTTVNIESVQTTGGANQVLPDAGDPEATDSSTGGFIAISNLRVDLVNRDIYATLSGGNGVGTVDNLKLWKINSFEGPTSFTVKEGVTVFENTLSVLTIYENAFELFAKAGGLTPDFGKPILENVNNLLDNPEGYGTIKSTIRISATAVPEPTTYALMGVGLVGLGWLSRRRQCA